MLDSLKEQKKFVYNSMLELFPKLDAAILEIQLECMSDEEISSMYYVITTFDKDTIQKVLGD